MVAPPSVPPPDEPRGLRRFRLGAVFGLVGGVVGLLLPISVSLLGVYTALNLLRFSTTLVEFTGALFVLGAVLLILSLSCYRLGFGALRRFDRWFLTASVLCNVGTVGLCLIIVGAVVAIHSSPTLVACVRASPAGALGCLAAVAPLTEYSVLVGFWLAWLGGLGVVVGLELGGRRYHRGRLVAGGALYALLLLVLIAPFVALLFPLGGWQYPLLTVPVLALVAPVYVWAGSRPPARGPVPNWS
jgi:hypothetical protein